MSDLKLNEIYATIVTLKNGSKYSVHHGIVRDESYKSFSYLKNNLSDTVTNIQFAICEVIPVKILE